MLDPGGYPRTVEGCPPTSHNFTAADRDPTPSRRNRSARLVLQLLQCPPNKCRGFPDSSADGSEFRDADDNARYDFRNGRSRKQWVTRRLAPLDASQV